MIIRVIFFSLSILSSLGYFPLMAQDGDPAAQSRLYMEQADLILSETRALDDARDLYVLAADLDPTNLEANFKAGDTYLKTIEKDRASRYLLRVYDKDPFYKFFLPYLIGKSYHLGMDFDKAIEYYETYRDRLEQRPGYRGLDFVTLRDVELRLAECETAKEFVRNPKNYSVVNLGEAVNSPYEDYAPVLNKDETFLVFTSRRRENNLNPNVEKDNKPFEDIFISHKVDGEWTEAENIGQEINTIFHDSNLALSPDGNQLFVYKDDNGGDIFVSDRKPDGSWGEPYSIGETINSSFKESSVTISLDGTLLIFSSNRPTHVGEDQNFDLYYSLRNDKGEWGRPRNLGTEVNTEFDEDGPFIDYDGKTLYFSSNGHPGMGGFDIFKTVYDSATNIWSTPENLGYPINTPDDDIYFMTTNNGRRGYYASVRGNGFGYTDLYMVNLEEDDVDDPEVPLEPVKIIVKVVDNTSRELMEAQVNMASIPDNVTPGFQKLGSGEYHFYVKSGPGAQYRLTVEREGYDFRNLEIDIPAQEAFEKEVIHEVRMRKLEVGYSRVLRNIYFDFDKDTFGPESFTELNKLEKMMAENPTLNVEIGGHADYIGTAKYNMDLSVRRANAVVSFLSSKGIDRRRLKAVGYGKTMPLASNDDEEEGRELNRRVEFKISGTR